MRSKKQRLWAFALILPFALSVVLGLSLLKPQTAKAETVTPLLRYDFSADNVAGNTIKNSGSKANSDATIVDGGIGTVKAENGKLKFNQSSAKQTSKDIGYLNLPTDMFNGLSAFTFRMDIDNAYVNTTTNGLFHFTKVDPMDSNYCNGHWTATKKGVESDATVIGGWWDSGKPYFYPNGAGDDRDAGNYVINNNYLNESFTLSVVWDGTNIKFYLNDSEYATKTISAADVQALVVNRVGGFLMGTWNSETEYAEGDNIGWGRNAVTATFDNIELYDSAMSAEDIKALNAKTVTVTDTALLSYDFSSNSVSADGKTVINKGSKENSDATIENSSNGIGVYSGKLKFSQSDDASKDNGYFKLPSDMFSGLSDFTFRMDVDSAKLNLTSLLRFLPGDPRIATPTAGEYIEASWSWVSASNDYFYLVSSPWDGGYSTRASAYISGFERKSATDGGHYITKPVTISVVWDGNFLAFYVDGITMAKTAIAADKVSAMTFNTVGGYLYGWGRNATYGTFDNIELYDRAFSVKEINAKNAEFKDDTELLLDYDFESASVSGNVVANKGAKADSDATLVGSRGGKIQDGKLIFARTDDYEYGKADAENSYLSLPSDMFKGLDEFTLSIDVDYADVYSFANDNGTYSTTSLWHFTDVEPTGATATNNRLEFEWKAAKVSDAWKFLIFADDPAAWNANYANWFNTAAAAGKCVNDGGNVRYDDFNTQQFTLSVVYKNNGYKVYWDDVQVYESGANTIYPANFANFIVNRFGGMYYGRNAACGEFDNIKMWNKALSTEQLKANATRTETQVITTGANESVVAKVTDGTYILPKTAEVNDGQQLIGYIYNNALYAPGDTVAVSGRTVRVKAVVMNFAMQSGAWIRTSSLADSGLRFRTYYSFDYNKLVQRLSDNTEVARVKGLLTDNLSFGTLVTFADAIDRLGDVSKENEKFNIEGKTTYIDIKTNSLTIGTDEELGNFYNSAIVNLNSYTTEYAARSYVTVTYAGEKTSNYYTAYSRENNARSAKTVALAAKNSADYANYTEAQKEIIETYIGAE